MKPSFNFSLIFFLGLSLFVACTPDNFDEIAENELPFTPTEIEETGSKFSYKLQGVTKNYTNGFGKKVTDSFYAISSDSIFCGDTYGSIRTKAQELGFLITYFELIPGTYIQADAVLSRIINGDTLVGFSGILVQNCSAPPVITISNQTPTSLTGTYEGEFFTPPLGGQDPNDCNNWTSIGILTADFTVPVENCN